MWILLAISFCYWNRLRGEKTPPLPVMMMMITWNTAENSLNVVFAWVARYGSFTWSIHLLFQMHKTSMLIIHSKVQKLYFCYNILRRQIYIQLYIPVLCSKHLTLFRVLCRPQALSREPIFLHRYANSLKTWEKTARCCQCQGTAREQSCEPCPWSWMTFFTWLKWLENKYCWELKCVKNEIMVLL